jgi:DnaJ-class molecular chaperone
MQERKCRPAMAASASPRACFWCFGTGRIPNDQHERYDRCDRCNGTGARLDRRLQDAPAVEVVATAA